MAIVSDSDISLFANVGGWTDRGKRVTAIAIALAESGGDAAAVHTNRNGSKDYGLWQINSIHSGILSGGQWSNPESNAKMAYQVWKDAGESFAPWATFKSGAYLAFLPRANKVADAKITLPKGALEDKGLVLPGPLGTLQDAGAALTDPAFWRRVAFAVVGGILILWSLMKLTGDNQLSPGTKAAVKLGVKAVTRV